LVIVWSAAEVLLVFYRYRVLLRVFLPPVLKEVPTVEAFSASIDSSNNYYIFCSFYFEYFAIRDSMLSISY
jgi:hypothetical protein